jgi:hypothetical protein
VPRSQRQEHRLPSKIVHPPANQVSEDSGPRNSELAANLLELFEGVPESSPAPEASAPGGELEPSFVPMPHTLAGPREKQSPPTPATPGFVIPPPSAKTVNRDETAMRRIRMDTAHLDPNALRLHIKIPRRFLGKWFQGTEEVLSIYGHQRETKLGSLGLAIQFSFSQSGQGKVYPQVVVTRSTNIRDIPYAHHSIEIRANRNAEAEQGWDHIQLLERGHVAQVDLSATDQVRGIMYIHVLHPKTGNLLDSIHLSWSVKE